VRVARLYEKHADKDFPKEPTSINKVTQETKVIRHFVPKIRVELEDGAATLDPEVEAKKGKATGICGFLDIEQEHFILGLRAEGPVRYNQDYCNQLLWAFDYAGNFGLVTRCATSSS
jgi:hypothetical protein